MLHPTYITLQFRDIETGATKNGKAKSVTEIDIEVEKSRSNDVRIPRKVELKILKNRNGKTGCLVPYDYYPAFNYFTEDLDKKPPHDELIHHEFSPEDEALLEKEILDGMDK